MRLIDKMLESELSFSGAQVGCLIEKRVAGDDDTRLIMRRYDSLHDLGSWFARVMRHLGL